MAGLSDFLDYTVVTDFEQIKTNYDKNTAIICSTDYYALKVYFKGVSADVFGFDNIKMLEEYSLPIHSVDYSVKEIADKAVEALFSNQSDDTIVSHRI
jgi:DNA-binding LacI/PurR family transcriptional regulator